MRNVSVCCAGVLAQALTAKENGVEGGEPAEGAAAAGLDQYKSLIRQQDARLQELMLQLDLMLQQNHSLQVTHAHTKALFLNV